MRRVAALQSRLTVPSMVWCKYDAWCSTRARTRSSPEGACRLASIVCSEPEQISQAACTAGHHEM
eukprot:1303926-Lingulodinium_polyedra.AAC.1